MTLVKLEIFLESSFEGGAHTVVDGEVQGGVHHLHTKFRRYVDQSMRQMKTSQFDFFDDVCGKKFMKCPRVLSL